MLIGKTIELLVMLLLMNIATRVSYQRYAGRAQSDAELQAYQRGSLTTASIILLYLILVWALGLFS